MSELVVHILIFREQFQIVNSILAQCGIWPMLTRLVAPGSYAKISDGMATCIA